MENALRDAKLSYKDLNEVILVGGSTRIPAVQELVKRITGRDPNVTVNPDEVVALGAAVQVCNEILLEVLFDESSIRLDKCLSRLALCWGFWFWFWFPYLCVLWYDVNNFLRMWGCSFYRLVSWLVR